MSGESEYQLNALVTSYFSSPRLVQTCAAHITCCASKRDFFRIGSDEQSAFQIIEEHSWYKWANATCVVQIKIDPQSLGNPKSEKEILGEHCVSASTTQYPTLTSNLAINSLDIEGIVPGTIRAPNNIRSAQIFVAASPEDLPRNRNIGAYLYKDEKTHQIKALLIYDNEGTQEVLNLDAVIAVLRERGEDYENATNLYREKLNTIQFPEKGCSQLPCPVPKLGELSVTSVIRSCYTYHIEMLLRAAPTRHIIQLALDQADVIISRLWQSELDDTGPIDELDEQFCTVLNTAIAKAQEWVQLEPGLGKIYLDKLYDRATEITFLKGLLPQFTEIFKNCELGTPLQGQLRVKFLTLLSNCLMRKDLASFEEMLKGMGITLNDLRKLYLTFVIDPTTEKVQNGDHRIAKAILHHLNNPNNPSAPMKWGKDWVSRRREPTDQKMSTRARANCTAPRVNFQYRRDPNVLNDSYPTFGQTRSL